MAIQRTNVVRPAVIGSVAVALGLAVLAIDEMMMLVALSALAQALTLLGAVAAILVVAERLSAVETPRGRTRATEALR